MGTSYDKNGNLKAQGANTYTYDTENRLTQRTLDDGGTLTYEYGGDSALVRRRSSDGTATVYIGGIYEKYGAGPVALSTTKYYKALGRTIAMRTSSSSDTTYLLSDHLGSTTTTSTNGLIAKESYYPFGATRSTTGTIPTDRLFTGQRQEPSDALGLYNYGARFYSTALGRFMSVDPVAANAANPQSWNPYSYVRNSPLRYTDPTGMCIPDDDGPHGCGLEAYALHSHRSIDRGETSIYTVWTDAAGDLLTAHPGTP